MADKTSDLANHTSDMTDHTSDLAVKTSAYHTYDLANQNSNLADHTSDLTDKTSDSASQTSDLANYTSDLADQTSDLADQTCHLADNTCYLADQTFDICAVPGFKCARSTDNQWWPASLKAEYGGLCSKLATAPEVATHDLGSQTEGLNLVSLVRLDTECDVIIFILAGGIKGKGWILII
jgi:uncharacterized phage infection (PIP) family protein YhgE